MTTIFIRVIGSRFKPAKGKTFEIGKYKENPFLIRDKDLGAIPKMEVTRDKEVTEFSGVRTIKCIWFSNLDFFGFWISVSV